MRKKLLAAVLAVTLLLTLLPVTALAAPQSCAFDLTGTGYPFVNEPNYTMSLSMESGDGAVSLLLRATDGNGDALRERSGYINMCGSPIRIGITAKSGYRIKTVTVIGESGAYQLPQHIFDGDFQRKNFYAATVNDGVSLPDSCCVLNTEGAAKEIYTMPGDVSVSTFMLYLSEEAAINAYHVHLTGITVTYEELPAATGQHDNIVLLVLTGAVCLTAAGAAVSAAKKRRTVA